MVIYQRELLPCVLARRVWRKRVQGRRIIHFIDNNAARDALIKGYTSETAAAELVGEFWLEEARNASLSWFCRVPSASNPSDGPSRGDFSEVEALGSIRVAVSDCSLGCARPTLG